MGGERMRQAGAARRQQEREQEPPPDPVAESVAGVGRIIAGSDAVRQKIGRHERAIAAEVRRMRQVAAECPDAERLAVAADKLAARVALVVVELISDAAHNAEAREALERCTEAIELRAASASFTEAMRQAAFEAGRIAGVEEEQARVSRVPRGRHAARSRHLKVAGGIAASSAVAASLVAGSAVIASQDSAAVRHWSPSPVSVRLHAGPADSAVLVPPVPSRVYRPPPRPSMAAASARPAPSGTPSPSAPVPPAPAPSPSASTPADPVLNVPRLLDLGASILGELTLSAEGQAVTWTATTADGITLSSYGGVVVPGEPVSLRVTDPTGDGGWVYISFGGTTIPVQVTSSLGVPALGL